MKLTSLLRSFPKQFTDDYLNSGFPGGCLILYFLIVNLRSLHMAVDFAYDVCYYNSQEGDFFPGPGVIEDAPVKREPRYEVVNVEDYKGGNLP